MKKILSLILILGFNVSCSNQNKKWYSEEQICECYSKTKLNILSNFDSKLNDCLANFNNGLSTENLEIGKNELEQFTKDKIFELSKDLIQNCPKYQKDFNRIFLDRYSKRDTINLLKKIDSISNKLIANKNNTTDLINLAEYEILQNDLDSALDLLNMAIEIDPKIESSYFVRSYIYQKKGILAKSIADYKNLESITNNSDMELMCQLMILNLQQQIK